MIITNKLTMDLKQPGNGGAVYAMQNDLYTRALEITLLSDGVPWMIPGNAAVLIRYSRPDGSGGEYSTLPDGRCAWNAAENILSIVLAPQVLAVPGAVRLSVTLLYEQNQISTFAVTVCVEPGIHFQQSEAGDVLPLEKPPAEPHDEDIPKVFFGDPLPQTKEDQIMAFRYVSRTADICGWCKTKAQGSSSMQYPKKNQTVKLYADPECSEPLQMNFKNWGPQNKFCLKANWIDLTHARNVVSARLWGAVVRSRPSYEALPEALRTSPNLGAVDGFPVKVYADGVYQGRYTLNIPKDAWMANMDPSRDTHCILCGENFESGCFRAVALIDGSDWTDEIHDTVPDPILTRWNEAIFFVMNSSDTEFISGIGAYFDVDSLIDYYLFGLASCGLDAFAKNQLYLTYDGQKWYASMYDMDSTWGLYWDGQRFVPSSTARTSFEDYCSSQSSGHGNLLYIRLEQLFMDAIQSRWEELKSNVLSIDRIIVQFERFTDIAPQELVAEDYAATTGMGLFTQIPSQTDNNIQQIRSFARERLQYVDSYISSYGQDPDLLYRLPGETVFDGIDDVIDTGVRLYDTQKDFSVVLDVTQGDNSGANTVWGCDEYGYADHIYNGVTFCRYPYESNGFSVYSIPGSAGSRSSLVVPDTERVKIAVVFVGGILSSLQYKTAGSSNIVTVTLVNTDKYAYTRHDNTMIIGAMHDDDNNTYREYWNGTLHSLAVYNRALTTSEISAMLA